MKQSEVLKEFYSWLDETYGDAHPHRFFMKMAWIEAYRRGASQPNKSTGQTAECTQCEGHVRLIREVRNALIRAGKDTFAGYCGRFAECIDEMAQEIRRLSHKSTGQANKCGTCGKPSNNFLF